MPKTIFEEKELIHELELEVTRYSKKIDAFKEELAGQVLENYNINWHVKKRASLRRAGLDLRNAITEFNKKL